MENNIDGYLQNLKAEMKDCDRATVQDALSDAEEYLRNALDNVKAGKPGVTEQNVFDAIVEEYGTPAEIADAYRKIEARTSPSLSVRTQKKNRSFLTRFFGVVIEPRAWGALLYLLFTLATGIIYFTWTVTGISLSLGLLILIIGIPIADLFILSTPGAGAAGRTDGGSIAGHPHAAPPSVFIQGQGDLGQIYSLIDR